jgi:integral membrane sensor domain MASE1
VLVVRVALASRRHLQVVGVVLSYWVGKVITCSTFWIYVVGDIHGLL